MMGKYVVIDIKAGSCHEVSGKRALSRFVGVSVPTVDKWFSERVIYLYRDKIIGVLNKIL